MHTCRLPAALLARPGAFCLEGSSMDAPCTGLETEHGVNGTLLAWSTFTAAPNDTDEQK